ncbi:MAG: hypothetical protein SF097_20865 [Acidobacteriota bacterium]|nr:hypothetical protein [Acidobacteriota bacterium]
MRLFISPRQKQVLNKKGRNAPFYSTPVSAETKPEQTTERNFFIRMNTGAISTEIVLIAKHNNCPLYFVPLNQTKSLIRSNSFAEEFLYT